MGSVGGMVVGGSTAKKKRLGGFDFETKVFLKKPDTSMVSNDFFTNNKTAEYL